MATPAHQKASDEGRARHSVRAGSATGNSGAQGTDAPYRSASPIVIVAVLLGAFFLMQSLIPLRSAIQIGADEGFEVAKATLCLHGHKLYSEVWNDQPPLHTWLITQVLKLQRAEPLTPSLSPSDGARVQPSDRQDALARNSILGPRLVTSAFTALLLVSVFLIVWRVSGLLVGTLTTALLLVSPGFLELSSSCMLEIPSLATAIAGLCVLVVVRPGRWHAAEISCGILFGLAALMKLVPLYLLPLAALIVWLRTVGRVTPCAPLGLGSSGAHGVTRPTSRFMVSPLFLSDLLTAHEPQRRNAGFPTGERADWKVGVTDGRFMGRSVFAPSIMLKSLRRLFVALLVIGVSLAATFVAVDWLIERGAFLVHFGQSWSSHFGGVKSFEFGSPKQHVFDWNILLKNWDLTVPAVLGVFVLFTRLRKGGTAMLPLVWLALALLVFTNHKPW